MKELYEEVALHLTGEKVAVRFRQPATKPAGGEVSKMGSIYFVDVSPNPSEAESFKTFLHEVAHIRLHGEDLVSSGVPAMKSGSLELEPYDEERKGQEADAERLAAYLWDVASRCEKQLHNPVLWCIELLDLQAVKL